MVNRVGYRAPAAIDTALDAVQDSCAEFLPSLRIAHSDLSSSQLKSAALPDFQRRRQLLLPICLPNSLDAPSAKERMVVEHSPRVVNK